MQRAPRSFLARTIGPSDHRTIGPSDHRPARPAYPFFMALSTLAGPAPHTDSNKKMNENIITSSPRFFHQKIFTSSPLPRPGSPRP